MEFGFAPDIKFCVGRNPPVLLKSGHNGLAEFEAELHFSFAKKFD